MKAKWAAMFAVILAVTFVVTGIGICEEKDQVSLKDWTNILQSKVAESVGDKGIINYEDQYVEVVGIGAPPERYYGKPQARPLCVRARKP